MAIKRRTSKQDAAQFEMASDGSVTIQVAADLLGITYQALKKWRDEGMPVTEPGGRGIAARVHMKDIFEWRQSKAVEKAVLAAKALPAFSGIDVDAMEAEGREFAGRGLGGGSYDYNVERARKTAHQATIAEIEALKSLGQVVPIEAVAGLVENEFAEIRAGLLNLPSTLSVPVSTMEDEREISELIRERVTEVLDRLSRPEDIGQMARDGVSRLDADDEDDPDA